MTTSYIVDFREKYGRLAARHTVVGGWILTVHDIVPLKSTGSHRLQTRPPALPFSSPMSPQFAEITQVPFPSVYKKFLETIGVFNLDLGWIVSAACLATGIGFFDKLL